MVVALIMFYVATADVVYLLGDVTQYVRVDVALRERLHASIIAHVAEIVDAHLVATLMIIFRMAYTNSSSVRSTRRNGRPWRRACS